MQGLSAFFAPQMNRQAIPNTNYAHFVVNQAATGDYMLNTNSGNRQPRVPSMGSTVMPKYPWIYWLILVMGIVWMRLWTLTGDFQFSRAAVNYIWKLLIFRFVRQRMPLISRLDPQNPPFPWPLQPTILSSCRRC
jgi:hypothetical protein